MRNIRYLIMFVVIGNIVSNHLAMAETTGIVHEQQAIIHQSQEAIDWPGIYLGFTPCSDCMGIKTTLALNKNNSYVLITQYVNKSDREFVEKGKYTWEKNSKTISLTPRNGNTVTRQYVVGENTLTQLDDKGELITGKLAEKYILHRKDVAKTPQEHSGH